MKLTHFCDLPMLMCALSIHERYHDEGSINVMWGYWRAHNLEPGTNLIAHHFKLIGLPDWIPEKQEVVIPSFPFTTYLVGFPGKGLNMAFVQPLVPSPTLLFNHMCRAILRTPNQLFKSRIPLFCAAQIFYFCP